MGLRKGYSGNAKRTTLTSDLGAGVLSFSVTDATGWPDGSGSKPFVAIIDRGLATQEAVLVTSRSTNLFTVHTRGYTGTLDQAHATGAVVEHGIDSTTIDEANEVASAQTTKGDLLTRTSSAPARLPVGVNGSALLADDTTSTGLAWGTLLPLLTPIPYLGGSTAPDGYFVLEGDEFDPAEAPLLAAAITAAGDPWVLGTETSGWKRLPDLSGRHLVGYDVGDTDGLGLDEVGASVGSAEFVIQPDNLAQHNHEMEHVHAIDHVHPATNTGIENGIGHRHAVTVDIPATNTDAKGSHEHLGAGARSLLVDNGGTPGPYKLNTTGDGPNITGAATDTEPDHHHQVNPAPVTTNTERDTNHHHPLAAQSHSGNSGPTSLDFTSLNETATEAIHRLFPSVVVTWLFRAV